MSLQKLLLTIALIFLLMGCSASPLTVDQRTKVDISELDESQPPTLPEEIETESPNTSIPSTSQTNPPQTPTKTSGAITLPIRSVTKKCISIEPSLPADSLSDGLLIIGDFTEKPRVARLFSMNSQNGELTMMENLPPFMGGEASPNLTRLMYDHSVDDSDYQISVVASDGSIVSSFPIDDKWSNSNWIDENRAIFNRVDGSPTLVDIVDVSSGERKPFAPDLPNFFEGYPGETWGPWQFVYNPTMSRVAYKQLDIEGSPYLVLWNLETEEELYRLEKHSVHLTRPAWSPDGSQLAVVAMNQMEDDFDRFELFIIDYEGRGNRWVDIDGYFPDATAAGIKWSPDGRYIAISTVIEQSPILVLDTFTNQLFDLCVYREFYSYSIIWSPDSTQVVVPVWEGPSIIIDLENNVGAQLLQDYHFRPIAWLADSE